MSRCPKSQPKPDVTWPFKISRVLKDKGCVDYNDRPWGPEGSAKAGTCAQQNDNDRVAIRGTL